MYKFLSEDYFPYCNILIYQIKFWIKNAAVLLYRTKILNYTLISKYLFNMYTQ